MAQEYGRYFLAQVCGKGLGLAEEFEGDAAQGAVALFGKDPYALPVTEIRDGSGLDVGLDGHLFADRDTGPAGGAVLQDMGLAVLKFNGPVGAGLYATLASITEIGFNPNGHVSVSLKKN